MGDSLKVRKGVVIWVLYKGRGVVKTFTAVHKMPRYLLIYSKISFDNIYWNCLYTCVSFDDYKRCIVNSNLIVQSAIFLFKQFKFFCVKWFYNNFPVVLVNIASYQIFKWKINLKKKGTIEVLI